MLADVAMNAVFKGLIGNMQKGCLLLVPLLILLKTGSAIVKGFTDPAVKVQYQPLFGGILIWLVIACYPEIMKYFDITSNAVIGFVAPPVDNVVSAVSNAMYARQMVSSANTTRQWDAAVAEVGSGNIMDGAGRMLGTASGALIKSITENGEDFLTGLLTIFAAISRMVIETVRTIFLKFLIAVGPLAITFSLAEGFHHVGRYWFQKLFSVYCWALTLNILDHIVIAYYNEAALMPAVMQLTNRPSNVQTPFFMDQIIVGGMYMMVPWLTSSFLGGTNAGAFLSNKVSLFTTLVTTAVSTGKALINSKQ